MSDSSTPRPVLLAILDGWGHSESADKTHNAIFHAKTPNLDAWAKCYPISYVDASEGNVGLPEGQMGNSEVGHMNIGSGRVVMQELPKIDHAIATGTLAQNAELNFFITKLKASGGACHLLGLLSPGGVHSHQKHMQALATLIAAQGIPVHIHAILDGRDTPPQSALDYIKQFTLPPGASFATVSGRYYAMDRDKRWERVKLAYDAMAEGKGERAKTIEQAIEVSYKTGKNDEFVLPVALNAYTGMKNGDGILMANFRADRAREITEALLSPAFDGFKRSRSLSFAGALSIVEYSSQHTQWMRSLFPPESLTAILGEVLSEAGKTQLRIAETEKYAHVTFFFNGGREAEFPGEERILVPSPKVATYDLQPEMSAPEVTDKLVAAIESGTFDFIVVNYANADMVGHTGDMKAATKAVEAVDKCLGRVGEALEKAGGVMLITADHGNIEQLHDNHTGQAHTAHTLNKVPFTIIGQGMESVKLHDGILADIAPTVLKLMNLPQPKEMTGKSLF